jgi:hypothetical protein
MAIVDCHSSSGSTLEYGLQAKPGRKFLDQLLPLVDDQLSLYSATGFVCFRRYGQKRTSSMLSAERQMIQSLAMGEAYGSVDIGLMISAVPEDKSVFASRDFVMGCVNSYSSVHAKSLLANIADATISHGAGSPVVKEKIYHDDVYLWRAFGNIPCYQKDPGVLLWFLNKGFVDLLPKKMVDQIEERHTQYNRDIEILSAAFDRLKQYILQCKSTPNNPKYISPMQSDALITISTFSESRGEPLKRYE